MWSFEKKQENNALPVKFEELSNLGIAADNIKNGDTIYYI